MHAVIFHLVLLRLQFKRRKRIFLSRRRAQRFICSLRLGRRLICSLRLTRRLSRSVRLLRHLNLSADRKNFRRHIGSGRHDKITVKRDRKHCNIDFPRLRLGLFGNRRNRQRRRSGHLYHLQTRLQHSCHIQILHIPASCIAHPCRSENHRKREPQTHNLNPYFLHHFLPLIPLSYRIFALFSRVKRVKKRILKTGKIL